MHHQLNISSMEAMEKLKRGNKEYLTALKNDGDISPQRRQHLAEKGQLPYAIIITCSDSRVVPESIFMAGLGELFVIRVAGNVIDSHQLGSIEYCAGHLGAALIVVLGHTQCGAVDAAIHHDPDGFIKYITDDIKEAIGDVTDPYEAACLNVHHCVQKIEDSLEIKDIEHELGLKVVGALYHLESGKVEFLQRIGIKNTTEKQKFQ